MSSNNSLNSARSSLSKARQSKGHNNNSGSRTKSSLVSSRRGRRGGRRSRSSFGSRSRVNNAHSTSSANNNFHKIIIDGQDVTPVSLLPALNAAPEPTVAANGSNNTTAPSLLQQRHQPQQQQTNQEKAKPLLQIAPPSVTSSNSAAYELSEEALDQDAIITLVETDTIELFSLRGCVVHQESDMQRVVSARNEAYKALAEKRKNKDLFATASAQTLNQSAKSKKVQAEPPLTRDAEVTATNWDIYDSQAKNDVMEEWGQTNKDKDDEAKLAKGVKDLVTMCLATPGSLLNVDTADEEEAARKKAQVAASGLDAGRQALQEKAANRILSSAALNDSLRLVERIIQQGYYHNKQLAYHDLPPVLLPGTDIVSNESKRGEAPSAPSLSAQANKADVDVASTSSDASSSAKDQTPPDAAAAAASAAVPSTAATAPSATSSGAETKQQAPIAGSKEQYLKLQWSFKCSMTKGRNVSSMVWNPRNPNLLAVSYGSFEFGKQDAEGSAEDGMILFWSLKNPEYPERALTLPSGVTSIDFSTLRPHILAAGLYDGTIAIFDTRLPQNTPVFESNIESGRHSDTVWQVKWIMRGGENQTETLVSISTDGRVKEWSIKKGLSHVDLMTLKRVPNQTGPQWKPIKSKGEGVISRLGNGLCFSFPSSITDTVIYFVGTEDGVIHKCSSSYNEQYLGSYHGHTGPVYKIKCHPADPNVFLSCSADWVVKLWSADKESESELTFHQMDLNDVVHDVEWAPHNATVFASVTADGRIEIWDVNQSALVPAICHKVEQVVDEVALAAAQEEARIEAAKKKKKKRAELEFSEYDEFLDEEEQMKRIAEAEADEEPEVEVVLRPKKLSCVRFADGAQIVVTGDDTGAVDVYKMFGVHLNDKYRQDKAKELDQLHQAMHPDPVGNSTDH